MMEDKPHEIPGCWIWTRVGIVGDVITGNTPPKNDPNNYGDYIPLVKPPELKDCVVSSAEDHLSQIGAKAGRLLPPESVLVSCIGNLGKTGINKIPIAFNQQINAIIFYEGIASKYGFYYFQTLEAKRWLNEIASATTIPIVNKSKFETTPFPIPPLPEQHRIVAKMEEHFTKLDAGIEALKKIKAQLKRYRQAVLKYAFEGKLTQEWREANKGKIEPASVLLGRIKEQRKKETKRELKELPPVDTSDLPELPEGWVWTRIGEIARMIQYGTSEKAGDDSTGVPVIRMGNIYDGKIIFGNLKYFPKGWSQVNDFILRGGDILFNRTNSMELVGKTAVYKDNYPKAVFASYLIRVRVNNDFYIPEMISFSINSFYGRKYIASVVSQQVGQANVNGTKLSLMPIPLPSLSEQQKIVKKIESRFSIADNIEKAAEQSLKQSDRLRQSILKRAFEGKLVPQDHTDEPAEKLLKRIREEKARQEAENKIEKKHKSKKTKQMELI